ncbi:hypothetical protein JW948_09500 [bacterium]|nr:hypothetical protein [bacterium]
MIHHTIVFQILVFCLPVFIGSAHAGQQDSNPPGNENTDLYQKDRVQMGNWSLGCGIQWFNSQSGKAYSKAFKQAGFTGCHFDWFTAYATDELDEERGDFRRYYFIERQINAYLSAGGLFTKFYGMEVIGYDLGHDTEIHAIDDGEGYYLYALARKERIRSRSVVQALQAGCGAGVARIRFSEKVDNWHLWDSVKAAGPEYARWVPSGFITCGCQTILFRTIILGFDVHYWYVVPVRTGGFTIDYNGIPYQLDEQKIDFGGWGYGVVIGLRL